MRWRKRKFVTQIDKREGGRTSTKTQLFSIRYISSDSTNYIVSRFTKSTHGYVHSFNGFQYMNSVPQWIINTPFSEQKSCVVTYGPIQTFNHLKRERDPRAHKEKKKRAPTRRLPPGERFTASAFNACMCVCVCVCVCVYLSDGEGRIGWLVGWFLLFLTARAKRKEKKKKEEERR